MPNMINAILKRSDDKPCSALQRKHEIAYEYHLLHWLNNSADVSSSVPSFDTSLLRLKTQKHYF